MKRYLKILLTLVFIGIASFLIVFYYVFLRPHRVIQDTNVEFKVTAEQLFNEFKDDENKANAKYLDKDYGKVILVTGNVARVDNDNGRSSIAMSVSNAEDEGGVICYLDSTQNVKIKELEKGKPVSVKGVCTGWVDITSEVDLVQCYIVK